MGIHSFFFFLVRVLVHILTGHTYIQSVHTCIQSVHTYIYIHEDSHAYILFEQCLHTYILGHTYIHTFNTYSKTYIHHIITCINVHFCMHIQIPKRGAGINESAGINVCTYVYIYLCTLYVCVSVCKLMYVFLFFIIVAY